MNVTIQPRRLSGAVTPPGSKSMAHRLLIAAALASGVSVAERVALSEDIEATLRCLAALGASWSIKDGDYYVTGIGAFPETSRGCQSPPPLGEGGASAPGGGVQNALRDTLPLLDCGESGDDLPMLDCGESGSTLRFLIPIALAVKGGGVFTGRGRLMSRPQSPYWDLFDEKSIFHNQSGDTLTVRGRLAPGLYRLPGDVSSQFFTGLLFALSCTDGESTLESVTPLQSAPYVAMTLDALSTAGIGVAVQDNRRFVVRGQPYRAFRAAVETDWSQAAFWYAANFIGAQIDIRGLNPASAQGDKVIADLARRLSGDGERVIDVSDCPDLLPPLAAMAAARRGLTRFVNAARLRMKESDRLSTTARMLRALGAEAEEGPDFLSVTGGTLRGGVADGANDHRIIMAAAVAACACTEPVTITGADAVRKSYPDFWTHYESLGGEIHVL